MTGSASGGANGDAGMAAAGTAIVGGAVVGIAQRIVGLLQADEGCGVTGPGHIGMQHPRLAAVGRGDRLRCRGRVHLEHCVVSSRIARHPPNPARRLVTQRRGDYSILRRCRRTGKRRASYFDGLSRAKGDSVILAQNGKPVARLTAIGSGAYPISATFGQFRCRNRAGAHFTIEQLSEAIADSWAGKR